MHYIVIIEMEADIAAAQRFTAKLDALIIEATQLGGIAALTSLELEGRDATIILDHLAKLTDDGPASG